jgi:ATP-grasp domain-containing protein
LPAGFGPPWFLKPVVGRLSQEARRVDSPDALGSIHEAAGYRAGYGRIAELAGLDPDLVHGFLMEELVEGVEVTLEGYVFGGRVTTVGITDSVKYEGTNSFERFEYPSALSEPRQTELADIADRLLPALGFDGGFFNVEFLVPEEGPARIVEVNGRLASQFAPLVQAVEGRSTYEALVRLSCGEDPEWVRGRRNGVAISYALRVFEDALVAEVPDPEEGLEVLVRPGLRLSDQGTNDPHSYRLAIFSEWAPTREEAVARCRERAAALRFALR